ncbi:hypothetical protein [Lacticaseibacillus zhaodongensis]|uniref:hypothetical protein n=1 Tax=Lacticaseibacillus zhaodongensis TaxID=2668065 RepID=UPI0012D2CFDB|nr:hypothetical protein [Lacticaseibacillus zhaodongensis]
MKLRDFGKKWALGIATVTTLVGTAAFVAPAVTTSAAQIYMDGTPTAGFNSAALPNLNSIRPFNGVTTVEAGTKLAPVDGHGAANLQKHVGVKNAGFPVVGIAADGRQEYYQLEAGAETAYVSAKAAGLVKIGTIHVNYPAKYGIQIWTAQHTAVKTSNGKAKKLPGQTNWNVYGILYKTKNGKADTVYYDLGGDQYIDRSYCTFHPNATFKAVFSE